MSAVLSPYVRSQLLAHSAPPTAGPSNKKDSRDDYTPTEVTSWLCCKCGESHDDDLDARECCMPDWLKVESH